MLYCLTIGIRSSSLFLLFLFWNIVHDLWNVRWSTNLLLSERDISILLVIKTCGDVTSSTIVGRFPLKRRTAISSSFLGIRLWPLSAFSFLQWSDRLDKKRRHKRNATGCLESLFVVLQFNLRHDRLISFETI